MGIINHSTLLYNGLQVKDTYISINRNVIRIFYDKNTSLYTIEIPYCVFASLEAKNNQCIPLLNANVINTVDSLATDVYSYGYQQLKSLYPNYSDA